MGIITDMINKMNDLDKIDSISLALELPQVYEDYNMEKNKLKKIKVCGYCGSDHGCSCRRKLEDQDWKDRFYMLKRK